MVVRCALVSASDAKQTMIYDSKTLIDSPIPGVSWERRQTGPRQTFPYWTRRIPVDGREESDGWSGTSACLLNDCGGATQSAALIRLFLIRASYGRAEP